MKRTIYIISERSSPRLDYVLDEIFLHYLKLPYQTVLREEECPEAALKIHYSPSPPQEGCLSIFQHDILFEDHIYAQRIEVQRQDELPYFFQSFAHKRDYHFDLFAVVFYMLSRYEEYLRYTPDSYGRFCASHSLAHRHDFLKIPIVDLWTDHFKHKMEDKWGIEIAQSRQFEIIPTFDIDTPYAYLNRSMAYHIGAIGRDIILRRWHRLEQRWKTYRGKEKDIFDTYSDILALVKKFQRTPIFFFLMNLKLPDDQNFSANTVAFRILIQSLSRDFEIGIHPSLQSHNNQEQWQKEYDALHRYSTQGPTKSRQHFLKLSFPETYAHLCANHIEEDYSMGFHDDSGFRAGTSLPFRWYNLNNESAEKLKIHPHMTMDATLRHYQKLSPEQAISEVSELKEQVKKVDGRFSFIWHNSSWAELYGWREWRQVLEEMMS